MTVKGECTEVCRNVRVQEKQSAQENAVCAASNCGRANEQERRRAENEREEMETSSLENLPVSLYPKK